MQPHARKQRTFFPAFPVFSAIDWTARLGYGRRRTEPR